MIIKDSNFQRAELQPNTNNLQAAALTFRCGFHISKSGNLSASGIPISFTGLSGNLGTRWKILAKISTFVTGKLRH